MIEEKIIRKVDETLEPILSQEINTNNLEILYKLTKIRHMAKEDECMNYGYYKDYRGYSGNYGRDNYGEYGRRGYDTKYRGYGNLDKVYEEYGRYMDSRERYGNSEESDKSFHYMNKSLEEFIKYLFEEAQNPQQKQELRETLQKSMM